MTQSTLYNCLTRCNVCAAISGHKALVLALDILFVFVADVMVCLIMGDYQRLSGKWKLLHLNPSPLNRPACHCLSLHPSFGINSQEICRKTFITEHLWLSFLLQSERSSHCYIFCSVAYYLHYPKWFKSTKIHNFI